MNNLDVTIYRHHMKYVNDEISAIATAFMTNGPKYRVNIGNILYLTIHRTQYLYEVWSTGDFMMDRNEISQNAIACTCQ